MGQRVKGLPADLGLIPRLRRSTGEGNGNPLQYSCLENPTDGGAWWATVHRVTKSRIWLSDFTFTFKLHGTKIFLFLSLLIFLKFIYFIFGCTGSLLLPAGFSLIAASGGYSLAEVYGLLITVVSLVAEHWHVGFNHWRTWAQSWHMGLLAPQILPKSGKNIDSSQIRSQTRSPALAGGLNLWTTREVLFLFDFWQFDYDISGNGFLCFWFSFLDVCFYFHNVWNILALFLQTLFFYPNLFLLLLGLQLTYVSKQQQQHMFQAVCLFFFIMDYGNLLFLLLSFFLVFFFSSHFIVLSSDSLVLYFFSV